MNSGNSAKETIDLGRRDILVAAGTTAVFKFGNFELSPSRRQLMKDGRAVKIGSRALDVLVTMVESAGQVVTKHSLMSRVWMNVIVEETNLRVHISILRRLLGDDGNENRYIVHVARRGYVFVAACHTVGAHAAETAGLASRGGPRDVTARGSVGLIGQTSSFCEHVQLGR